MSATKVIIGEEATEVEGPKTGKENGPSVSESDVSETNEPEGEVEEEEADDGTQIEDLDPKIEVWPGGPTVGQTIEWKKEYGEVYTTSLTMDFHVMWRPITRMEYKQLSNKINQISLKNDISSVDLTMMQEEIITELCTLYPKFTRNEMADELAGMPSIIAQQVMEASGFQALEVRKL